MVVLQATLWTPSVAFDPSELHIAFSIPSRWSHEHSHPLRDYPRRDRSRRLRAMPTHIAAPSTIECVGTKPKRIEEYIGRVNSRTAAVSVARMKSPSGWTEPGQTPEFEEYTLVLSGMLRVETRETTFEVRAGEAIITHPGEWIRYSTPGPEGAEYVAVCVPAFSPETVHRDE